MKSEKFCKERIITLKNRIKDVNKNLCIYTTGSYGRFEASEYSDIDLFFIDTSIDNNQSISRIEEILIMSNIIDIANELKFPEFSKDGIFLKIHKLENIIKEIGGANDDFNNYFTCRLLLLLESKPVYGEKEYKIALEKVIASYFKDFHKHASNFKPVFLTNDIIRFWKTLCLNYEHSRSRKTQNDNRNVAHLKNLKLGFSRKLTCFSFILKLLAIDTDNISEDDVLQICLMTPIQRLKSLLEIRCCSDDVNKALELYHQFLFDTQKPKEKVLPWIGDEGNRTKAFTQSKEFGKILFDIMNNTGKQELIQKLVI